MHLLKFPASLYAVLVALACASVANAGDVRAEQPWSRATPPGITVGVGYVTLRNAGPQPQVLESATSPMATAVEMHENRNSDQGLTQMRPVTTVTIPARGNVAFEPSGLHLMLVGLKAPLVAGQRVPVGLRFKDGTTLAIELEVRPLTAVAPAPAHHHH